MSEAAYPPPTNISAASIVKLRVPATVEGVKVKELHPWKSGVAGELDWDFVFSDPPTDNRPPGDTEALGRSLLARNNGTK